MDLVSLHCCLKRTGSITHNLYIIRAGIRVNVYTERLFKTVNPWNWFGLYNDFTNVLCILYKCFVQ